MLPRVGDNCSVVPSHALIPAACAQVGAHPSSVAQQNDLNYFPWAAKMCTSALLAERVIQGNLLICEAVPGSSNTGAVQVLRGETELDSEPIC